MELTIKKRVVLFIFVLLVVFATVFFVFIDKNNKDKEYKGTLVNGYCQEAML